MKFTIIIPAYNVEAYIDECLASVAAQSYRDWEAIVVDDGSTDGTGEKCDEWGSKDERIRVVHQENRGLSSARNVGIGKAKGEYILFVDGDDWIERESLSVLDSELQGEDAVCFGGRRYFQDEKRFEKSDSVEPKNYENGWEYYCENALKPKNFSFVSAVLRAYRTEFLQDKQLRFKEGILHEDNLFTPIVLYHAGKVRAISDSLYNYRVRKGSIMTTYSIKKLHDKVVIANELSAFFISKKIIEKKTVFRYITQMYQTVFNEQRPKETERQLLRAVDWNSYYTVSRTKLRHRVLYAALRVHPTLFRAINKCLSR